MTKGEARKALLKALTGEEISALLAYFEQMCLQEKVFILHLKEVMAIGAQKDAKKSVWYALPTEFFFEVLHYILIGERPFKIEPQRFLAKLEEIKNFLQERPISLAKTDNIRRVFAPINELMGNREIGRAFLTRHAWERFCERMPKNGDYERRVSREDLLRESFRRAKVQSLPSAARVRRIIDSGFKYAVYLNDRVLNLRYIVAENIVEGHEHPHIVTVEKPEFN